ncbi:MAG: hypothetical protein PUH29_06895, partial [Lachnospiraceae bacterium]|nr:hypothetical protein [Lachnospiraceae bacterium]MDY5556077.1 hypothetical protein [Blautia sp.]
ETEFNDSYATANQISTGSIVNGSMMNSSNEDYFKFTLPKRGYVSLTFKHGYVDSENPFWNAALYNGNYEWMMEREYKGNSTASVTSTKVGLSAGTYYLKITRNRWYY